MPTVTTSLSINFQSPEAGSDGGAFSAEIDSRPAPVGLNKGRTSFIPGDTVYILLYPGSQVSNIQALRSAGSLVRGATIVVDVEEQVTLANAREFSLRYPVANTPVFTWYGATPGALTKVGDQKFSAANEVVVVGKVNYQAIAVVYILSGIVHPAALVVFTGEAP